MLTPLLALGVLGGVVAYAVEFFVFTPETLTSSPLSRNHVTAATWTPAYWTLILVTSWRLREKIWEGTHRWIMPVPCRIRARLAALATKVRRTAPRMAE